MTSNTTKKNKLLRGRADGVFCKQKSIFTASLHPPVEQTGYLQSLNKIVIFSHGMGVRKDNRGLFTELSGILTNMGFTSVLFDYDKYDPKSKEILVGSFSENAIILQNVINTTIKNNPNSEIIVIAQSQGGITAALCDLTGVSKFIAISPFFHTKMKEVLRRYTKSPDNEVNFTGISRRKRSDGTTTILKPKYWQERFEIDPIAKYNHAATKTILTLICPLQDEIMNYTDLRKIKLAKIVNIDGDHDFSKQYRAVLIDVVLRELN